MSGFERPRMFLSGSDVLRVRSAFDHPGTQATTSERYGRTFSSKLSIVTPLSMRVKTATNVLNFDINCSVLEIPRHLAQWDIKVIMQASRNSLIFTHKSCVWDLGVVSFLFLSFRIIFNTPGTLAVYCGRIWPFFDNTFQEWKDQSDHSKSDSLNYKADMVNMNIFTPTALKHHHTLGYSLVGPSVFVIVRIDNKASILTAELYALQLTVEFILEHRIPQSIIFSDSCWAL